MAIGGIDAATITTVLALAGAGVAFLFWLEQLELVEVEWNPFSLASRAARAERAGQLAKALRLYDRAGQTNLILECLTRDLPDSPARAAVLRSAAEILELKASLDLLHGRDAPELRAVLADLSSYAETASEALWSTADRLSVALVLVGGSAEVPPGLQAATEKVDQLFLAIIDCRTELAELVLLGHEMTDLRGVVTRFGALAAGMREIREVVR